MIAYECWHIDEGFGWSSEPPFVLCCTTLRLAPLGKPGLPWLFEVAEEREFAAGSYEACLAAKRLMEMK